MDNHADFWPFAELRVINRHPNLNASGFRVIRELLCEVVLADRYSKVIELFVETCDGLRSAPRNVAVLHLFDAAERRLTLILFDLIALLIENLLDG